MNSRVIKPHSIVEMAKETFQEWTSDNAMRLSAALAYYAIFSAAPLLLIVIGIVGWAYGPEAAQGKVAGQISSVVGKEVAEAVQSLAANAKDSGKSATLIGLATLLVGASGVFAQLKDALNTIWEVRQKAGGGILGFIQQRLFTFGMVLAIGFLLLVSLIVATVVTAFGGMLEQTLGMPAFVTQLFGFLLPLVIETLLFALMFKFLPDAKIPWSSVWVGAAFTAVLFEIGKFGLTLYLSTTGAASSFGAAGSAVLLLLWVYYSSLILFFGAEFTEVYARRRGHEILPGKHGECVRTCEREKEGLLPKPHKQRNVRGAGVAAVAAELHPLSEDGARKPEQPIKETVAPLMADERVHYAPPAPALVTTEKTDDAKDGKELRENPLAEVGAAVGAGLLLGLLSRFFEQRPVLGASEHLTKGAKVAAAAGLTAMVGAGPKLKRATSKKELKRTGQEIRSKVNALGEALPKKVQRIRWCFF